MRRAERPGVGRESHIVEADVTPAQGDGEFTGREWDVTLIGAREGGDLLTVEGRQYIRSKNERLYSVDGLRDSVGLWEGVKVFDNHLSDEEFQQRQGMRSVANEWVGTIVNVRWDESAHKLRGRLKVVDEALGKKLKAAHDAGVLDSIGLSIDTVPGNVGRVRVEGDMWPTIESFEHIFSVDVVSNPAAGGAFDRIVAAITVDQGVDEMGKLLTFLQEADPEELKAALAELGIREEVIESEPESEQEVEPEVDAEPVEEASDEEPEVEETEIVEDDSMTKKVAKLESQIMMDKKLARANLSAKFQAVAEAAFDGRVVTEAEVDKMVKQLKGAQAEADTSGRITGAGGGDIKVGMASIEKAEMAFLDLVAGSSTMRKLESISEDWVKDRMPESYRSWQNAGRPNYRERRLSDWLYNVWGGNPLTSRAREAVTTATVTTIIKNTVNLLVAADYSERRRWFEDVVTIEEVDTIDDITLARLYGTDTLDTVTEGAAYTEMDWTDEEETASFVKRGNYMGITMETMLKDKLNVIRSLPRRLSNSWFNTQSALVSAVFTTNTATGPVMNPSGALFNATAASSSGGHANLGTTALSYTTWDAAVTAMMKQTDQALGAGTKLLIQPHFLLVPVDLRSTATQIRNSEFVPVSMDNDVNPYYQGFEIITVPEWTETDHWAAVADPRQWPAIYLVYLRGLRTPEIFEAGDETAGSMFTNDTLRFKVRLMIYRFSSTYDCAPVADFRPLYKANV